MKTTCLVILLSVYVIAGGCAVGESYTKAGFDFGKLDKVAIIDVEGAVRGEAAKNQVGDFFVMELLKRGYSPIERAQVQTLLKEQKFQVSDVSRHERQHARG